MRSLILVLFLVLAVAVPPGVGAEKGIYLNFDQVEVKTVAQFLAKELGKNVIFDETLRGKITIITKRPVSRETAWRMFTEALSLIGATVYEEKGYVKILSRRYFREETPRLAERPSPFREPALMIYALSRLNPTRVSPLLKPLLSPTGQVFHLQGTPVLILRDYASNLSRVREFLEALEKEPGLPEVRIFRLRHAPVEDLYRNLSPLLQTLVAERGLTYRLIKDERTNSLIVYGNEAVFSEIERLLRELDVPVESQERRFYVIHLKYSSAEDLAKVLRSLNLERLPLSPPQKGKQHVSFRSGLRIGADKSTNALIVYATPAEFRKVRDLVDRLDVRRKQVLLATTVVEISLSKLLDLGVRWQILGTHGGAAFGGISRTDLYSAISQGKFIVGALSTSGRTVSIGGTDFFFPELFFLFSLLEEDSSFRILSNPRILTLDNRKAVINVGQSVPYTTGITYQTNTLPTVSFEYKDVGLNLTITPHIVGNTVRLEIHQTIQQVTQVYRAQQGTIDFVAPVTSKREISSEVIVDNGQTVILGGLVSRKNQRNTSAVPGLSRVPLLGHLFRRSEDRSERTTLFVFITPYIISSPEELKRITEEHRALSEDLKALLDFRKESGKASFSAPKEGGA